MGNRAVICKGKHRSQAIGIYLHWNGGRDSVEAFLSVAKEKTEGRRDDQLNFARLTQVISNYFDTGICFGVDLCKNLDCDNFDNGVYEVDFETLTITGRKFFEGPEQQEYSLQEMIEEVKKAQP